MRDSGTRLKASRDILRLNSCPDCGYSLQGLGAEGRCPECGWVFTAEHIVLYGWIHRLDSTGDSLRRTPVTSYSLIITMIVIGAGIAILAPPPDFRASGFALAVIGVVSLIGFAIARRQLKVAQGTNAGPWQLRITPQGWGLRFGPGPLTLNEWDKDVAVEAQRLADNQCVVSVVRSKNVALWTLKRGEVPIQSAAVIMQCELNDVAPVIELAARWLGTSANWRLNDRKEWIVSARAPV